MSLEGRARTVLQDSQAPPVLGERRELLDLAVLRVHRVTVETQERREISELSEPWALPA